MPISPAIVFNPTFAKPRTMLLSGFHGRVPDAARQNWLAAPSDVPQSRLKRQMGSAAIFGLAGCKRGVPVSPLFPGGVLKEFQPVIDGRKRGGRGRKCGKSALDIVSSADASGKRVGWGEKLAVF